MNQRNDPQGALDPDRDRELGVDELSRCCRCSVELIVTLAHEGVIEPQGAAPADWRFADTALPRVLCAVRLSRDLEINAPGVALALDLLERIRRLELALGATPHGALERGD